MRFAGSVLRSNEADIKQCFQRFDDTPVGLDQKPGCNPLIFSRQRLRRFWPRLRLALESLHAPRVLGKGGRQDLDCYIAMELGIGGTVNGAHAALAELGVIL
jgi:hypothetical protein